MFSYSEIKFNHIVTEYKLKVVPKFHCNCVKAKKVMMQSLAWRSAPGLNNYVVTLIKNKGSLKRSVTQIVKPADYFKIAWKAVIV